MLLSTAILQVCTLKINGMNERNYKTTAAYVALILYGMKIKKVNCNTLTYNAKA
jgi:hypothetical protein